MSEQANNGQVSTQTGTVDANVADGQTPATQATGDTQTTESQTATGETSVAEGQGGEGAGTSKTAAEGADTGKPEGDKAAIDGQAKAEGDDKAGEVPETYTFTAPEGVTLDEELVGEFSEIAKELKLPQEAAQKVADLGPKIMQKFADHQAKTIVDVQAKWTADSKADAEFGGEQLDQNRAIAKQALEAYGTPELKTLLVDSGLGNHPEVLRVFYRIGKELQQDGALVGRGAETPKDLASKLYPNHKP